MSDTKHNFSERLNQAIDESGLDIPPKGENRQKIAGKLFGVGQSAVRKWLEGEGLPKYERSIEMAKKLKVSLEWLMSGRGDKRMITESSVEMAHLLDIWNKMPEPVRDQYLRLGEALLNHPGTAPPPIISPERRVKSKSDLN